MINVNDLITAKLIILCEICFDDSDGHICIMCVEYQYCVRRVCIILEK